MSLQDFSTQFITEIQGINHFQQYNFEILNYTSLNFARPSKPSDSHTAFMTAERRKLLDQLPRLNTNVNNVVRPRKSSIKSQSKGDSSNASNPQNSVTSQSPDHDKNPKVTPRVKFVIDPNKSNQQQQQQQQHRRTLTEYDVTADPDNDSKLSEDKDKFDPMDNNIDNDNRKKKNRLERTYRRASAPAQGIDYYFKNAKHSKMNTFYYNSIKKDNKNLNSLSIPTVQVEIDETAEPVDNNDNNDNNVNNDNNNDNNNDTTNDMDNKVSTSMSSSITSVSSCNPPSLSPCSSNSSLSSSIDMTSPSNIKQPSFAQAYNNLANPLAMKQKSKSHPTDISYQSESHSLPDIVTSPYSMPWSPAALYLSGFANSNVIRPKPDEEGQQVGDYIIGKVIGRGGFSTVKQAHAIDQYSGSMNTVAVKIVRNHGDSDDNDHVQALLEREIAIWRRLDHPNIVRMSSVIEYDDYATFVFSEYCPGGTLLDYIKKHSKGEGKGLDEDEARNIFLEIAEGVRYLHNDVRLVHKDIKLDNILLDNEDTWKICDFGLTEFQNSVNGFDGILYNTAGGSIAYCAPEQLRSPTPIKDPSVDVWSLGVVLFAMVTGQLPFSDSFEPRLQFKIINGRYDESLLDDSGISNELRDLFGGMFKTKPDQRLTISQVLEHRWCER